jgi:hypothetical protein
MNCCAVPGATAGFAGVTAIETRTTFTVRLVDPVTLPSFALTVLVPAAFAVTMPPAATVKTLALDELQVAVLVRSFVLPLLYVPIALICCFCPAVRVALGPVT